MSHPIDLPSQAIQFYSTASYRCSYLPEEQARSLVAAPAHLISPHRYSELVRQGFRRSGAFTYKPDCDTCRACVPMRIDVQHFRASRSQRRCAKQLDARLNVKMLPLHWKLEHYELYVQYQRARHPESDIENESQQQYKQFLLSSHVESRLLEFRTSSGKLKIVSIVDLLDDGLSAVYTFFNPSSTASLGTYAVLWQLELCSVLNLPWLYLGYWIRESRKMLYKTSFRPYQLYRDQVWAYPST